MAVADFDTDAIVVGAGVVGLACAHALARRGLSVVVLEREGRIGQGISSRNSEVIHAGLHYPPGSLRARLCVEGKRALYDFLPAHGVAFERCGKLIVATREEDIAQLEHMFAQGRANGVEDLSLIDGATAKRLEPALACVGAILSGSSGILEAHGLILALQGEIEGHGGVIALNAPFLGAASERDGWRVRVGGAEPAALSARGLVVAAGLSAQECARAIDGFPAARIPPLFLGKGNYFALTGRAPFQRLVYPTPIPGALGVHYKRDVAGQAHFGPDLEFVDAIDYRVNDARAAYFQDYVRRFWPGLPDGALRPDFAGIRPKLHGPSEPQGDFVIDGPTAHGLAGLVALFGIESPGLTSSLAIGEEVARLLKD